MTADDGTLFPPLTVSRDVLLSGGRDDKFRDLVNDMIDFAARLQSIRESLARRMGVTPPQYNILMALAHHRGDDKVTVTDLAGRLRVSVPFIVTETRRLGEAGLLRRAPDLNDRRRVYLELTAEGRAAIVAIAPAQRRVNDELFSSLTRKNLKTLHDITSGLLASCDAAYAEAEDEAGSRRRRSAAQRR